MAYAGDVINLSDDDNPQSEPVIIVDDDNTISYDEDIQEISEDVPVISVNPYIDKSLTENIQLAEIIECCLEIDSSQAMYTVINKNLAICYKNACDIYKRSVQFKKDLRKVKKALEVDPNLKYSHIQQLCRVLKYGLTRKRRKKHSTMLETFDKLRKRRRKQSKRNAAKDTNEIIDLEEDELNTTNDTGLVIDLADESDSETRNHDGKNAVTNGAVKTNQVINDAETTNRLIVNNLVLNNDLIINTEIEVIPIVYDKTENNNTCTTIKKNHKTLSKNENLLVPKRNETNLEEEVKHLENEIAAHHRLIEELEQEEVSSDDLSSPYLKSQYHKQQVVSCYERLCKLTGSDSTKRHKISLKAIKGHPPGPVRVLENFLNHSVGSDGLLSFPDIFDVVNCVRKANVRYNLCWNDRQIKNEARALFVLCGKALQKRRQRREWKDVLRCVKKEDVDHDPANDDPELQAKLEANKRMARIDETDLSDIDRYSSKQSTSNFSRKETNLMIRNNNEIDNSFNEINHDKSTQNSSRNSALPNKSIEDCRNKSLPNLDKKLIVKITPISVPNSPILIRDSSKENIPTKETQNSIAKHELSNKAVRPELSEKPVKDLSRNLISNLPEPNKSHLGPQNTSNNTLILKQVPDSSTKVDIINLSKPTLSKAVPIVTPNNTVNSNQVSSKDRLSKEVISDFPESTSNLAPIIKSNLSKVFEDVAIQGTQIELTRNILHNINGENENKDNKGGSHELILPENIKLEPTEILVRQLEALGDNYTTQIVDIEDPFLVIEISSGSSDEEDDYR